MYRKVTHSNASIAIENQTFGAGVTKNNFHISAIAYKKV